LPADYASVDRQAFDVPRFLASLPLFSDMSPPELERLATGCQMRRLSRGEMVFRVGEPCGEFHVAVTGQVKLFALSPAGQEKIIELIGPGQSFAEALMFTDQPYIINAQTLSEVLLLTVSKRAVLTEIESDSRFALRMLAGISRRLHGLVHDVEAYALRSGVQRVVGYLLRNQVTDDSLGSEAVVSLPVSKATLASRLSLTPEYFSRVLHELEEARLISVDKRDIHILDSAALSRYP
jgi:CRP-like cAMP-binding protein